MAKFFSRKVASPDVILPDFRGIAVGGAAFGRRNRGFEPGLFTQVSVIFLFGKSDFFILSV